ncbi:MAG: hypothetical protein QOJ19_4195 [Acidimicrobiia bacterium]|nr:hypothetical protein [Acidimicrobiia bacterium]
MLPFVALSMIAILAVLAIVIDLGATRSFRRDARSAADAGAAAGAVALSDTSSGTPTCVDAMAYAFRDVGDSPSSGAIGAACGSMVAACSGSAARTATLTFNSTTVTVTNPVPDGSPLMDGTSLGGGVTQAVNAAVDGTPCDRVGVEITRPQPSFFRGVVGGGPSTYTVHSVAVHTTGPGRGEPTPALVALNQSACKAIDSGNGLIYLIGNEKGPGIAYSDSDGPSCSAGNPIISHGSSGQVCAQSSTAVGQIGWFQAPSSRGYNTSASVYTQPDAVCGAPTFSSYGYVGQLFARSARITRKKIDAVYRCSSVDDAGGQPLCAATADPVELMDATSSNPSGFPVYTDCSTSSGVTFSSDTFVDCAVFSVKGGIVSITNGATVIFNGSLSVEAGGDLRVNAGGAVTAEGYPVPTDDTKQTKIIINSTAANAFNLQSTSANVRMAQTTVYSKGGFSISGSPVIRWTPPTDGDTVGLLYWSESTQQFSLSGSPSIFANGVFFQGNGKLFVSGGGLVDLTKVQMWVDTVGISGGGGVKLSADPKTAITPGSPGSALIR